MSKAEPPIGRVAGVAALTALAPGASRARAIRAGGGLLLALGGYPLLALYPPLAALVAAALIWRSGLQTHAR